MNRWNQFLSGYIPEYLKNSYIDEIVICDETGEDAKKITESFGDNPKVRVFVNEKRLGVFRNKDKVVSLAKNDFVCLMDSDNFAPESYFQAWLAYLNGSPPDDRTIYMPYRTIPQPNHGGFDYSKFSGRKITKDTYKQFYHDQPGNVACNTGNYIVSKKFYTETKPGPHLDTYVDRCSAADVRFKNHILWENGATAVVVPGMDYHHIVHPDSLYTQTCNQTDLRFFDSLYT
jgi:glycosyltransferase involved in cell wall biosynthesis